MEVRVELGGDIFMARINIQTYTEELLLKAVRAYAEGSSSYKVVAKRKGIRNVPS